MSLFTPEAVEELAASIATTVLERLGERPAEELYVSPARASEMTGLGESTLWALIADGMLPTLDVGVRRTLIPVSALRSLPTKVAGQDTTAGRSAA